MIHSIQAPLKDNSAACMVDDKMQDMNSIAVIAVMKLLSVVFPEELRPEHSHIINRKESVHSSVILNEIRLSYCFLAF